MNLKNQFVKQARRYILSSCLQTEKKKKTYASLAAVGSSDDYLEFLLVQTPPLCTLNNLHRYRNERTNGQGSEPTDANRPLEVYVKLLRVFSSSPVPIDWR